ncbi:ATP-binding cassette domain-containing protein [Alkalisalibacterium limincola]|uniref:ATP-binding cassette domain-containing protein n=1 Tax=Alkalisalibacterium limincola TaxID=2699169 RepID=UPI001C9C1057|nr:ATP-binding cassette domain-containing protein [Alkalisalibacterium limincola]
MTDQTTPTGGGKPAIAYRNANVTYGGGVHAMKDLTLDIEDGQFVVIVGSSGAGKSTLMRSVNGLIPLSSGSLEIHARRCRPSRARSCATCAPASG